MDAVRRQPNIPGLQNPITRFFSFLLQRVAAWSSTFLFRPIGDQPHVFQSNHFDESSREKVAGRRYLCLGPAHRQFQNTFFTLAQDATSFRSAASKPSARTPIAETHTAKECCSGFRSFKLLTSIRRKCSFLLVCRLAAQGKKHFFERVNSMSVRKLQYYGIVTILAVAVAGCSTMSPPAFPGDIGAVAKTVAASMSDQAVWQNMAANVNGHVTNPGLEVAAGIKYVAEARLVGVSGSVGLSGQGTGTGVTSPETGATIRKILTEKPEYTIPAIPNLTSNTTSGGSASVSTATAGDG